MCGFFAASWLGPSPSASLRSGSGSGAPGRCRYACAHCWRAIHRMAKSLGVWYSKPHLTERWPACQVCGRQPALARRPREQLQTYTPMCPTAFRPTHYRHYPHSDSQLGSSVNGSGTAQLHCRLRTISASHEPAIVEGLLAQAMARRPIQGGRVCCWGARAQRAILGGQRDDVRQQQARSCHAGWGADRGVASYWRGSALSCCSRRSVHGRPLLMQCACPVPSLPRQAAARRCAGRSQLEWVDFDLHKLYPPCEPGNAYTCAKIEAAYFLLMRGPPCGPARLALRLEQGRSRRACTCRWSSGGRGRVGGATRGCAQPANHC